MQAYRLYIAWHLYAMPCEVCISNNITMYSMTAAINCGTPSELDNGAVTFTSTTFQSQATFTCDSGYSLEGSSSRTCQSDGTWSGQTPVCNRGIYVYQLKATSFH